MQITEQLIERIARRVFNSMFAPALRQSNVQGGGTPSSVRYAEEAGHAASADAVAWTGVTGAPDTATRWPAWSEVTGKPSFATVATSGSYNDLSNKPSIPSVSGSVSGSTLTITINGSSYSLTDTNTWRPVQNNLNSTATGDSLSAYQGYLLARGSARDETKLPLVGGTMTGTLGLKSDAYGGPSGDHGLNCNNSDIVGVNSIYTNDTSDGWDEGILFKRSNGNWDSFYALNGTWYFMANNGSTYADIHAYKGIAEDNWASKSDARLKNVLGEVNLTVEQIAAMPAVQFTWKNRNDKRVHVGTLAQQVQKVLPEVVGSTDDDILTVAYSEAAFVSVVKLAQRVLKLEELIKHGTHK